MEELNCDPDLYPGFAFNPDTILRIEILIQSGDDPINNHNDIPTHTNESINDWVMSQPYEMMSVITPSVWRIMKTLNISFAESSFFYKDQDEQLHATHIETPSDIAGDEGAVSPESNLSRENPIGWRIITLHLSSRILTAESRFFYQLFSNWETEQRHVILRIHSSEEAAIMELLNYMYSNTLAATLPRALLDGCSQI